MNSGKPIYTIEQYTHDYDPGLAVMWNESDHEWPGSFTDGVPMTAERWGESMDKEVALMRLVVVQENGPIVGFGSLWDSNDRKGESCYVDLLNVHPAHQGRSLCRRMLTQMIDFATEQGYVQVTLGTWTANLKALPLYKKTGFFWRPDTSVYMENFIPAVRQLPILVEFFQQADWYQDYDRTLDQVEDEERHPKTGEMKVYINRWTRANNGEYGETIEAIFDRQSQQLCGLDTPDLAAYARIDETKPAMGLSYDVIWSITNKRERPVNVSLEIGADEGINIRSESTIALRLNAGENQLVRSTYCVTSDAPKVEVNKWHPKPMPSVRANVTVDGTAFSLSAGLHYQKPIEVTYHPDVLNGLPGQKQTVLVQIQNYLTEKISGQLTLRLDSNNDGNRNGKGTVAVDSSMHNLTWQKQDFAIEPEGFAGVPLTIESSQTSGFNLQIQAEFTQSGQSIQTPPAVLPCLIRHIGGVVAVESEADKNEHHIFIENDFIRLKVNRRGNSVNIVNKAGWHHNMYFEDTLGPGFYPFEFGRSNFDLALHQEPGISTVTSTIVSKNFPGVEFCRVLTVTASPIIQVQYRLRHMGNVGSEDDTAQTHICQVLTYSRLINLQVINGQSVIPLADGLVQTLATTMPSVDNDFPQKPDGRVGEEWAAYSADGQAHGLIWSSDVSEHIWKRWGIDLISAEYTIAPQETVMLNPFYLYAGPGDWRDVRRVWQSVNSRATSEPREIDAAYNNAMPVPKPTHQVRFLPEPLVTITDEMEATLQAENVRPIKLNGTISLELPNGWQSDINCVDLKDLAANKTQARAVHLTSSKRVGATEGRFRLQTQYADEAIPFPLIRLGNSGQEVSITQHTAAEQPLWRVANGCMVYTVTPDFHGGLIDWREQNSEVNHLFTSFPVEGEFKWIKPWFGGVRPMLTSPDSAWPGKLHEAEFLARTIEVPDQRNLPWRGVRLDGRPVEESALGIHIQLEYLTLPGSNVIKLVYRRLNRTNVYQNAGRAWPIFGIYCQVDGDMSRGALHGDYPGVGAIHRKRSEQNADVCVDTWAAVENPETGRAIVVVAGERGQSVLLEDADSMGGHIWVDHGKHLPPNGQHEMVTYMALAGSVEEAKRYAALNSMSGS
ncbi:MAG: GNAT family N-acetyltransferase [Chloroflexota bacterium]